MNARQLIASGAVALLLAPAAFANSSSSASSAGTASTVAKASPDACKKLESRFEDRDPDTKGPTFEKARLLRAEGSALCTQGKTADGVKKLEEAIKMLGSPPAQH